jgi:hypothetical protein
MPNGKKSFVRIDGGERGVDLVFSGLSEGEFLVRLPFGVAKPDR